MFDLKSLSESATQAANTFGIEKFDIYGNISDDLSLRVKAGTLEQVSSHQRANVLVRVWSAKKSIGVATTTDHSAEGLRAALGVAAEAAIYGSTENAPDFSPEANTPCVKNTEKSVAKFTEFSVLLNSLLDAEKRVLKAHPAIESVPYNSLSESMRTRFYLNSVGAQKTEHISTASIYLYTKTNEQNKKPRSGHDAQVAVSFPLLNLENCVQNTISNTLSHLNYKKIQSGNYLTVFSPEALLSLIGAFQGMFDAQKILDSQSLSKAETLGSQIASDWLTVADDPLNLAHVGGHSFDGEGTPTRITTLIENGILKSFMHSSVTARRMNQQLTGHANMGAKITLGTHFMHVSRNPNKKILAERNIKDEKALIYIEDLQSLHAGVNANQGSFSLPFSGWIIENGVKTSIEQATVAGDILKLLKEIVYIDKKETPTHSGIAPEVWVGALSITCEG